MNKYPRRKFEMTQDDLNRILEACQPVPMIMLHISTPRSQQERANDAWRALGARMGFEWDTVEPTGEGDRFFTAIPSETDDQRKEREAEEAKVKLELEIVELESTIAKAGNRLAQLKAAK